MTGFERVASSQVDTEPVQQPRAAERVVLKRMLWALDRAIDLTEDANARRGGARGERPDPILGPWHRSRIQRELLPVLRGDWPDRHACALIDIALIVQDPTTRVGRVSCALFDAQTLVQNRLAHGIESTRKRRSRPRFPRLYSKPLEAASGT